MNFLILSVLLFFVLQTNAFYMRHTDVKENEDEGLINEYDVNFKTNDNKEFPDEFEYTFTNKKGELFQLNFVKIGKLTNDREYDSVVFTPDGNGKVKEYEDKETSYKLYRDIDNRAVATLIRNNDLENEAVTHEHAYRMLINIMDPSTASEYNIAPVLVDDESGKKNLKHALFKRSDQELPEFDDNDSKMIDNSLKGLFIREKERMVSEPKIRHRRALNGQPVPLYVEYLIVSDSSVFEKYRGLLKTNNTDIIIKYLKTYYAHLVNAVNQRYLVAFQNDLDMNITVVLVGMIIETMASQSNWSNPAVVGETAYPKYNGQDVILTTKSIGELANYVKRLNLSIAFDHAVGLTIKDIWSATTTQTPSQRSGPIGYAYVGGICNNNIKYAIVEERGFSSTTVLSHELGHNLNAPHDTFTGNCTANRNYLMTAVIGFYADNLLNQWYFSPCSIGRMKVLLLVRNSTVSSSGSCLTNVPSNPAPETNYFKSYLPGQLFTPDQQCRLIMNFDSSSAVACGLYPDEMCNALWCLGPTKTCISVYGWGALDGTTCDKNKICYRGNCVNNNNITTTQSLPSNACTTNPCLNGGSCLPFFNLYVCNCASGFTGQKCETKS